MTLLAVVLAGGCEQCEDLGVGPGDDDEDPVEDVASAPVSSNQSGSVTTASGAKITVPMYAVPLTPTGTNGTMSYSIERTTSSSFPAPSGETLRSNVYRFGPEGFTFAAPVRVTIPVPNASTSDVVSIFRTDPTTGAAIRYPGEYDPQAKTVSAMTTQLSVWGATTRPSANTANGAVRLVNTSSNSWLSACVDQYTLTYPAADPNPQFGMASAAPGGTIGWNSSIVWGLPQGSYRVCRQMATAGTVSSPPGQPVFWYLNNVNVNKASVYPNYEMSATISYGSPPAGATAGNCPCRPTPTPSVGTGQVQVTLTWFPQQAVDLDLYVTDPSGATVSYERPTVPSGGSLDRDNQCSNYQNGPPENVFWSTAPAGQYVVVVKWFSGCSGSLTSMPFTARVVNKSQATAYGGTVSASSPSVEVTRFTVR